MNTCTYTKNKHMYGQLGGRKTTKKDINIKKIYKYSLDKLSNLYDENKHDKIQNGLIAQVFNLITVFGGDRSGMLYETHNLDKYGILKIINHIVSKFDLSNIKTYVNSEHTDFILVYHKDNEKHIKNFNQISLGKLLDFVCSGQHSDMWNDRIFQEIHVDKFPFFVQGCSEYGYNSNIDKFDKQFKKFKKLGKKLGLQLRMEFHRKVGIKNLLIAINKKGSYGLIEHKDNLYDMVYGDYNEDSEDLKTLKYLKSNKLIKANQTFLKNILTHILLNMVKPPLRVIEEVLYSDDS